MRSLRFIAFLIAISPAVAFANDSAGYQQPFIDITGTNQIDGVSVNPNTAAPGNFTTLAAQTATFSSISGSFNPTGSIATQGVPFSKVESGNPLLLETVQSIPVASINAAGGYTFITGVASRTLYPANLVLTATGTASGATSVVVQCTGGLKLGTFNIAQLVNNVGVSAFSASVTPGQAFEGCASGDGVFISAVGAPLATTTAVFVNMPYTIQ